ncbi:hypothetical protein [Aeromicrobium chenweiae]|uniref:Uncharacterized protein n=1 Tax=Aeromicrobium chenweiae TaxID=2079793 RepID=A0A2S0WKR1_9ACTN|nr:hypothetical protein [Aeromicrobium chenweiae]AWB91938.1 hypothetical protein C3E78_06855 [Aeromicrobium chenweiae]TGN32789.1 hypothetical protein E4L97_08825 [Aeromicrobium chenweiae]
MTQPPTGPPQGPPPWGYYPAPPPSPEPSNNGLHVFGGAVLGVIATFGLPALTLVANSAGGFVSSFLLALLIVPAIGTGMLFSTRTRGWGIGVLIGWALGLVIAGGTCVALLSSLE